MLPWATPPCRWALVARVVTFAALVGGACSSSSSSVALGVDLGDQACVVASLHRSGIEVLTNTVGGRSTPSAVVYGERERFIGERTAGGMVAKRPHLAFTRPRWQLSRRGEGESGLREVTVPGDARPTTLTVEAQTVPLLTHMCFAAYHALTEKQLWEAPGALMVSVPAHFRAPQRRSMCNILAVAFAASSAPPSSPTPAPPPATAASTQIEDVNPAAISSPDDEFFRDMGNVVGSEVSEEREEAVGEEKAHGVITDGSALALAYGFSRRVELAAETRAGAGAHAKRRRRGAFRDNSSADTPHHCLTASIAHAAARMVAFVDMGHSSLQVTVAALTGDSCEVLAHAYDTTASGAAVEELLFRHVVAQLVATGQLPPRDGDEPSGFPASLVRPKDSGSGAEGVEWQQRLTRGGRRLMEACARAKKTLSANTEAHVSVDCLVEDQDVRCLVRRAELEAACDEAGLPARVTACCRRAFVSAADIICKYDERDNGGGDGVFGASGKKIKPASSAVAANESHVAASATSTATSENATLECDAAAVPLHLHSVELVGGSSYVPTLRKAVLAALQEQENEGLPSAVRVQCDGGVRQTLDAFETVARGCALRAAQVMIHREEHMRRRHWGASNVATPRSWFGTKTQKHTNQKTTNPPQVVRSKIRIPTYRLAERSSTSIVLNIKWSESSSGAGSAGDVNAKALSFTLPAGSMLLGEPLTVRLPVGDLFRSSIPSKALQVIIDVHDGGDGDKISSEWHGIAESKGITTERPAVTRSTIDAPEENEPWWMGLKNKLVSGDSQDAATLLASTAPTDDPLFLARFVLGSSETPPTQNSEAVADQSQGRFSELSLKLTVSADSEVAIEAVDLKWSLDDAEVSAAHAPDSSGSGGELLQQESPPGNELASKQTPILTENSIPLHVTAATLASVHSICNPVFVGAVLAEARGCEARQRRADEAAIAADRDLNALENLLYQVKELLAEGGDDDQEDGTDSRMKTQLNWAMFLRLSTPSSQEPQKLERSALNEPLPSPVSFLSADERQQLADDLATVEDWLDSAPLSSDEYATADILVDAAMKRRLLADSDEWDATKGGGTPNLMATASMRRRKLSVAVEAIDALLVNLAEVETELNACHAQLSLAEGDTSEAAGTISSVQEGVMNLRRWILESFLEEKVIADFGPLYMDQPNIRFAQEAMERTQSLRVMEKTLYNISRVLTASAATAAPPDPSRDIIDDEEEVISLEETPDLDATSSAPPKETFAGDGGTPDLAGF
jgi:molecular chaperone DnaK (HSP70)